MKNSELIKLLQTFPPDAKVYLQPTSKDPQRAATVIESTIEGICITARPKKGGRR